MRNLVVLLALSLFVPSGRAQIFGPQNLVNTNVGSIRVKSGDLDGDGDLDLVTHRSGALVWYENLTGQGTFGGPELIDGDQQDSLDQLVVDLDGDGLLDIVVSLFTQDRVVWYRNLGNGGFAPAANIAFNFDQARGIEAGDLDGDGDLDLVVGVTNGTGFYWLEHLDGQGTFGPKIPISATLSQARTQRLGDLDGDGDLDVVTNSSGAARLSWFENTDGQGTFSGPNVISDTGQYINFFDIGDMDGSNGLDIAICRIRKVSTVYGNGDGTFGEENDLFFNDVDSTPDLANILLDDIDNDGKLDIVFDSGIDFGKVYLLNSENYGQPYFILPPEGGSTGNNLSVDMDGDGDKDLINSSLDLNSFTVDLYWYENQTVLGTPDHALGGLTLSPNPVGRTLTVASPVPLRRITVLQVVGRPVATFTRELGQLDVSALAPGMYLLSIEAQDGTTLVKKLIKE